MEFLKNNKRFSFKLGEKNSWDLDVESEVTEGDNILTTVYRFKNGLKVTNIAKKYDKYGAYEWVNYFENTSDKPSEIISELWDCDCTLPLGHEEERKWEAYFPDVKSATKICAPSGSTWAAKEFYCNLDFINDNKRPNHIYPGDTKRYSTSGGRSSEKNAPFFNISKNGSGYILAIGWTGQWNCEISRACDSVTLKSKIEDTHFKLMPGEKLRTSSVVIMPYDKNDESHNKWRRLVKENFSLIGSDGRDKTGPFCAGIWGGMKTESVLKRIDIIKKNNLPFEYIWMDAGWYGIDTKPTPDEFEGDWGAHTGDWRISPLIHPNALKDVSKAVHDAGMKFLLWFEPERVISTTPVAVQHPEYFLASDEDRGANRLLNLGNPEAWTYCFETISGIIEEVGIDCYRQDFNFSPLSYWRKNDDFDRRGITEIKHINGMYKLWDALLEKFPNLIIDNCASGGRRIDIETLRRSIPLWRSDMQCPANYDIEASQCHNQSFNLWMPYSGTGSGRAYDEYRIRSAYAAALTTNYSFSEREKFCDTEEKIQFIKKYTEEYLKVRPYFSEDFYPLTEVSDKLDVWCVTQFNRTSENDGILQVFRREESPYETAVLKLKGLDADGTYLFTDTDGGEFTVSGADLAAEGLNLTVTETRKAKIYLYKKV
ncbi:MAG: alpha-galactosidase [Clostridia bacterium]|nr:alpha-galactosidase [Clostridia bacterium]